MLYCCEFDQAPKKVVTLLNSCQNPLVVVGFWFTPFCNEINRLDPDETVWPMV